MDQRKYNKILVTGSNGFVGKALCQMLRNRGDNYLGSVRDKALAITGKNYILVETLDTHTGWMKALDGCDTVVHLAGRGHILNDHITDDNPPAIYGRNAPGNFGLIERFIKYGVPLPFGSIDNKPSLVAIENIVSFIKVCVEHLSAANELFFVSDDDLSTLEVVELMGKLIGKKPKTIKLPLKLLWYIFTILGKRKAGFSLMSDLQLDIDRSRELLEWSPPFSPRM